jgi:hypothetical protein
MQGQVAHTITIEPDGNDHRLFLDAQLLSTYLTLDRARFAALLVARDINLTVRKLHFEPNELGHLIATVQKAV